MIAQELSIGIVAVAGLLSFFSPCILPLIPVYLGYLAGGSVSGLTDIGRRKLMAHAALFVAGFSLVFVILGATAGLFGQLLARNLHILVRVGALFMIVMGMNMAGLIRLPWLNMDRRIRRSGGSAASYSSSFSLGLVFAAGWTPCVGPVLSGVLLLAADAQTLVRGSMLLGVYSAGLAIPFLMAAAAVEAVVPHLSGITRYGRWVSVISGVLLIGLGFLLLTDLYGVLFSSLSIV